jgi:DNA modification methylase
VAVRRKDVDLDTKEGREMAMLDNLTTQVNLAWDKAELESISDQVEGFDVGDFGFEIDDLPQVVMPTDKQGEGEGEPQTEVKEDDFDPDAHYETKVKAGEVWLLGEHRLMCGDSTDADAVAKLMNGEKAAMMFTDPPYGVAYTGGVIHGSKINTDHKREMLKNDDIDIYSKFIPLINDIIDDGAIYIFYATVNTYALLKPLRENGIELNSIIVWNKINTGYADMNSNYKNKYEPCFYGKRKGHKLNFVGPTNECTVWDIEKDRVNDLHPTQKPVVLPGRAISNSSKEGDIVVDLFGGSGSTMIACEQLGRKCRMMELDPHYCTVIIARWEKLTGQKAVKLCE